MPLRIKLPHGDKIMINGAVIENAGDSAVLVLHNRVDILRQKEIMQQDEANTPARLVYYSVQCAYIFREDRARFLDAARRCLDDYLDAAPSAETLASAITGRLEEGAFYDALKLTRDLVEHEKIRLEASQP